MALDKEILLPRSVSAWSIQKSLKYLVFTDEILTLPYLPLGKFLGSWTGLGGGVVIVPLLAIAFGVDIRYAIGASLVSVIATSSGAAFKEENPL